MSFISKIIVFLASVVYAQSITLQEAMEMPEDSRKKYIRYDTSEWNIGLHAGLAILISYCMLVLIWVTITSIVKCTGRKRNVRTAS